MLKSIHRFFFLLLMLCVCASQQVQAQNNGNKTRILFLLDASGSMFAKMDKGQDRMEVAKRLLSSVLDSLSIYKNVEVALRVYGHQSAIIDQNCKDTKLEVGFKPNNHGEIKKKLNNITPNGFPISNPATMPSATRSKSRDPTPVSETPALANAKIGIIA